MTTMNALASFQDLDRLATIGWPPSLPTELALGVMEPIQLKNYYEIDDETWEKLPKNPLFVSAVQAAMDQLKADGAGFRMRAKLLAESNLEITQQMVHDKTLPANVRKDLLISLARWAGYDNKASDGSVNAAGAAFSININLGA